MFSLLLYPLLGWLFGSYTVLHWRRLTLPVLLQRLVITAVVSVMVVAVARWLIMINQRATATTITLTTAVITSRCNNTGRVSRRQCNTV